MQNARENMLEINLKMRLMGRTLFDLVPQNLNKRDCLATTSKSCVKGWSNEQVLESWTNVLATMPMCGASDKLYLCGVPSRA